MIEQAHPFEGKVCLVTGAGKGIGQAAALEMASAGAHVCLCDLDAEAVESTLRLIEETNVPGEAWSVLCDVTDQAAVRALLSGISARHQRLDILVHCAAVQNEADFFELTAEQWRRVVDVNLFGTFCVCQAAAMLMRDRADPKASCSGKIITLTSIHDNLPRLGKFHYDAAKAGVSVLTREMALALAPWRINVNAVAPGVIDTPMNQGLLENLPGLAAALGRVPWARIGTAAEVARLIRFLASGDADYITGAIVPIDGGRALFSGAVSAPDLLNNGC